MRLKGLVFAALAIVLALLIGVFWYKSTVKSQTALVNSFEECAARGYPIMESYPPRCRTPDGRTFAQDIGNELEKQDRIRIRQPRPNQVIKSPIVIAGEARGLWFFEASFPARLLDANGSELGVAVVQAQGDWMTQNFVDFRGTLTFQKPGTEKGTLILEKDNPSGLAEHADQLRVPVRFSE